MELRFARVVAVLHFCLHTMAPLVRQRDGRLCRASIDIVYVRFIVCMVQAAALGSRDGGGNGDAEEQ